VTPCVQTPVLLSFPSPQKPAWINLKWILLSDRSQYGRAADSMIPFIQHFRRYKTMETVNGSVFADVLGERRGLE
jgi:hypothetical protein